jgi:hypothetical protein
MLTILFLLLVEQSLWLLKLYFLLMELFLQQVALFF